MNVWYLFSSIFIGISTSCTGYTVQEFIQQDPQALLARMTVAEKIAQLCIIASVSNTERNSAFMSQQPYHLEPEHVIHSLKTYNVGGILFLGESTRDDMQASLLQYAAVSSLPLLVAGDYEWGLTMRMPQELRFPLAMTLAALPSHDAPLIYRMGYLIGMHARSLGVHLNLAPVADVNTNSANPVINMRSFGDNPEQVAIAACAYMKGMQDAGIGACAKHFPGHGDTHTDSHYSLPTIAHPLERLTHVELYPFKHLIDAGIDAVMSGHIAVPAIEPNAQCPASLSFKVCTQLLQQDLGFNGLVITDGLGMQAVTTTFKRGQLELQALQAGNDILLAPVDLEATISTIEYAVDTGALSHTALDAKVLKVLTFKQRLMRQASLQPLSLPSSSCQAALKKELYARAVTLIRNTHHYAPLTLSPTDHIAIISIGGSCPTLIHTLHAAYPYHSITLQEVHDEASYQTIIDLPHTYTIVVLVGDQRSRVSSYCHDELIKTVDQLEDAGKNPIGILLANPYLTPAFNRCHTLIAAYENDPDAQEAAARVLLGHIPAPGHVPVQL
jgi:beta-glucosidase-like glycosyl hydrolase